MDLLGRFFLNIWIRMVGSKLTLSCGLWQISVFFAIFVIRRDCAMRLFRFLCAVAMLSVVNVGAQNGKKIYADYHGVRYTRDHDGKLGRWEMHADTRKSRTGRETICCNADFMDENRQHDIAAVTYPRAGMQSNLDPDYIEYQILSARAAGIDGFFVEWGFIGHENDNLLKTMQAVAAKYGFEIGVNWCDGWLYYDWITRMCPEINTREAKTDYYAVCYQYLVDHVLSGPTAPMVNGRPVFYLFGPGAKPAEYASAVAKLRLPEGMKTPAVLRRWAEWGELVNDRYEPVRWSDEIESWKQLGMIPTAWLPARVRERDAEHPYCDRYARPDDLIEFMKPFRDSIWMSSDPDYVVKSGFVMPGMDNRGCAGWGAQHYYYIPRAEGDTYERMWQFNMASKDSLDMIFIASWNDYTEGHEIEPTVENGDRELRTTLKYASEFKQMGADTSGLLLPERLFFLRKRSEDLAAACRKTADIDALLDRAAGLISRRAYPQAVKQLDEAETAVETLEKSLEIKTIDVSTSELHFNPQATGDEWSADPELKVYLPEKVIRELISARTHKGYLEFEYLDRESNGGYCFIYSRTERLPKESFSTVAKFKTDGSNQWKKVRVELMSENVLYTTAQVFTLMFKGAVEIRNISFHYTVIR